MSGILIDNFNYICIYMEVIYKHILFFIFNLFAMTKKTVPVKPHKRSKPSPTPRKNPNAPKPGPKTVPVDPHRRSKPKG